MAIRYMPWTKLAIVNFRSAETCDECFRRLVDGGVKEVNIQKGPQCIAVTLPETIHRPIDDKFEAVAFLDTLVS